MNRVCRSTLLGSSWAFWGIAVTSPAFASPKAVWLLTDPALPEASGIDWWVLGRLAVALGVLAGAIHLVASRPERVDLAERAFRRLASVSGLSRLEREQARGRARLLRVSPVVTLLEWGPGSR